MKSKMLLVVLLLVLDTQYSISDEYAGFTDPCHAPNITGLIMSGAERVSEKALDEGKLRLFLEQHFLYDTVAENLNDNSWINLKIRAEDGQSGLTLVVQNQAIRALWTTDNEAAKWKLEPGQVSSSSQFWCKNRDLLKSSIQETAKDAI